MHINFYLRDAALPANFVHITPADRANIEVLEPLIDPESGLDLLQSMASEIEGHDAEAADEARDLLQSFIISFDPPDHLDVARDGELVGHIFPWRECQACGWFPGRKDLDGVAMRPDLDKAKHEMKACSRVSQSLLLALQVSLISPSVSLPVYVCTLLQRECALGSLCAPASLAVRGS